MEMISGLKGMRPGAVVNFSVNNSAGLLSYGFREVLMFCFYSAGFIIRRPYFIRLYIHLGIGILCVREINSTILGHEDNWKEAHKRRLMHRVQTKLVLFYYILLLIY